MSGPHVFTVAERYLEAWRAVHGSQAPSQLGSVLWPQMIQVARHDPEVHRRLVAINTDEQVAVINHVRLALRIEVGLHS